MPKKFNLDEDRKKWESQVSDEERKEYEAYIKRKKELPPWLKKNIPIALVLLGLYVIGIPLIQAIKNSHFSQELIVPFILGGIILFGGINRFRKRDKED